MAIDHAHKLNWEVETGLTHPFLWISSKSKKVEPAGWVYFPLPDLSRKIERDSAHRYSLNPCNKYVLKRKHTTQTPGHQEKSLTALIMVNAFRGSTFVFKSQLQNCSRFCFLAKSFSSWLRGAPAPGLPHILSIVFKCWWREKKD